MASEIERLGTNYVALLTAIPYLTTAQGGTITFAADIRPLIDFSTITPPFAVVVFDGENAQPTSAIRDGAVQQSQMEWSIFLGASSFSLTGEGALGTTGVYQMLDDAIYALTGKNISVTEASKIFLVGTRRYSMTDHAVVYQARFRNPYLRIQTVG